MHDSTGAAERAPQQGETQDAASGRMSDLERQIQRRRTFAIISHPDAGKTTLTEKLLLFGGAIQLAGQVKAKKDRRGAKSSTFRPRDRASSRYARALPNAKATSPGEVPRSKAKGT